MKRFLVLCAFLFPWAVFAGDWPMAMQNCFRSWISPDIMQVPLKKAFTLAIGPVVGAPVGDKEMLFVGNLHGQVVAVNVLSGKKA